MNSPLTFKTKYLSMHFADDFLFVQSGPLEYSILKEKLNVNRLFDEEWIDGIEDCKENPHNEGSTLNFFIDNGDTRVIITMHHSKRNEFENFIRKGTNNG